MEESNTAFIVNLFTDLLMDWTRKSSSIITEKGIKIKWDPGLRKIQNIQIQDYNRFQLK